jgi:hypothetical protein
MPYSQRRPRYCRNWGTTLSASLSRYKVVAAFTITAALALLVSIASLYFGLIRDPAALHHNRNSLDRVFYRYIAIELNPDTREFWTKIIQHLILGFSDEQLVTGTAILLAAFIRLPVSNGQISVYHFSIVTDLAWFSSNTHLVTLFVLRTYFSPYLVLRLWRTVAMVMMTMLLITSSIMTSHKYWYGNTDATVDGQTVAFSAFNCPTICMVGDLKSNIGGIPFRWMIVNVTLLV